MSLNLDVDECETNPCAAAGICTNAVGSFECECLDGYSGNGFTCTGKASSYCYFPQF